MCQIYNYVSMAAMVALLPLSIASSRGASAPAQNLDANGAVLQRAQLSRVEWDDAKRSKVRRAYWLLEHADSDYGGHKGKAMAEIKEAAKIMGLDLRGEGYGGENQKESDNRLREARRLLKEIVDQRHEREHERLWKAMQEIDKALAVK
jgi:spermidine/putrescine-binding protein